MTRRTLLATIGAGLAVSASAKVLTTKPKAPTFAELTRGRAEILQIGIVRTTSGGRMAEGWHIKARRGTTCWIDLERAEICGYSLDELQQISEMAQAGAVCGRFPVWTEYDVRSIPIYRG